MVDMLSSSIVPTNFVSNLRGLENSLSVSDTLSRVKHIEDLKLLLTVTHMAVFLGKCLVYSVNNILVIAQVLILLVRKWCSLYITFTTYKQELTYFSSFIIFAFIRLN